MSETVAPEELEAERLGWLHDDLKVEYGQLIDQVTQFDQRLLTIKSWGVTLSLASIGFGFQQEHYGLFLVAALGGLAFWVVEATSKAHQMRYYPRMGDIERAAYDLFHVEKGRRPTSSPLIDWGWYVAPQRLWWQSKGERKKRTRCGKPLNPLVPDGYPDVKPPPKSKAERKKRSGDDGMPCDPLVPDGDPATQRPPEGNETTGETTYQPTDSTVVYRVLHSPAIFPHVMFPHVIALVAGTGLFIAGLAGAFGSI